MIYFDNASTTSVRPEVARVYKKLIDESFANADAMHTPGRKVHRQVEQAREHIARSLGVKEGEILCERIQFACARWIYSGKPAKRKPYPHKQCGAFEHEACDRFS